MKIKRGAGDSQFKDFSFKLEKLDGETGTFEGYGSIFNNVDSYGEKVVPGAFGESLAAHKRAGTKPLMLWQHRTDEPIGVWDDIAEDGKGLWGKGRLLLGVRRADEAHIMLKAGAIQGLSIGYRELLVEPDEDKKVLLLKKLDLLEISIVSFPANRRARVEAVKSEKMEEFVRRLRDNEPMPIKDFEDFLREAGIPKAMATRIASVGYAKAIRSDSEGQANEAVNFLQALRG